MSENKTGKYFKYAIGEIILVVIGILIALQINNWNEARKERAMEVSYLKNLKADLINEVENAEEFRAIHFGKAEASSFLLNSDLPTTIQDVENYTNKYETVFIWFEFVPNNNTFKELLSSGNLSLIKNDSIKNGLLELDKLYAQVASGEHHMRREYEEYLYDINIKNTSALGFFDITESKYGLLNRLSSKDIPESKYQKLIEDSQWQHNNQTFQNGLKLAMMNNSLLAEKHRNLVDYIRELLKIIEEDINV
ncbi:DUF6090 family protein [Winogradskyella sp. A3E31]|uniref:DUF6090 family protein n=1 Tax=Winogradskyella sp. A3E31 TaxID=3349637 RepID=UPI00398B4853